MEHPKLRPVEAFPLEISGRQMIALRDPARIARDTVFVSEDLLFILQFFDGKHSLTDIQQQYFQHFHHLISEEQINRVVFDLDKRLFLESDYFKTYKATLMQEYRQMPTRAAAFAGQSYAEQPEALRKQLADFFQSARAQLNSGLDDVAIENNHLKGLVVPHIDIQAGGITFAAGYTVLAQTPPNDIYIILGTGHNGISNAFACSDKDFDTPLGVVKTDKSFLRSLQSKLEQDIFTEELNHKNEHTIEFQTIFLQYLFGKHDNWRIVPILCSFGPQLVQNDAPESKAIHDFLNALKQTIQETQLRVCVIASADLSHIGQRYGDAFQPDQKVLLELNQKDRRTLEFIEKMDVTSFVVSVAEDEQERRICGFPPIYSLLKLIDANHGKLLHYDHVSVDQFHSTVSFASIIFH